jgi:hypothetical protein
MRSSASARMSALCSGAPSFELRANDARYMPSASIVIALWMVSSAGRRSTIRSPYTEVDLQYRFMPAPYREGVTAGRWRSNVGTS